MQKSCALATSSLGGKPQVATVLFTADEKLNIYFETNPEYRKATNLAKNPNAAFAITMGHLTLQVEGTVALLEGIARKEAMELLLKKTSSAKKWLKEGQLVFKLIPNWARLRDTEKDEFKQII